MTIGTPVPQLSTTERRHIRPLVAIFRLTGPIRPLTHAVSDALLGRGFCKERPDAAQIVERPLRNADRGGMHLAMQSMMLNRPDLGPLLPSIAIPTCFAVAVDDPSWVGASARAAATHLPNGRVVVMPGAGHVAPLLQAAPVIANAICDFWSDLKQPGSLNAL